MSEVDSSRDLSRERFKKPEESISVVQFTLGPTGEFENINDEWTEHTGQSFADSLGFGYLKKIHPDDHAVYMANLTKGISQKKAFAADICITDKTGDRWRTVCGIPTVNDDGELVSWQVNAFDIQGSMNTNQKHKNTLTRVVRNNEQVTGLIAHEVRNPMQIIDGMASVLYNRWDFLEEEGKREAIEEIFKASTRLKGTVEDLIEFAKLRSERPANLEPESTIILVNSCVEQYSHTIEGRDIRITLEPDLAPIEIFQSRFNTILGNLLSNANKYSSAGALIDVSVVQDDEDVIFSVKDQGYGISEDNLRRIFLSFYRSAETSAKADGLGLGLSVVKLLVEQEGGRIWVESEGLGKGSTFSFTLPKAKEAVKDLELA